MKTIYRQRTLILIAILITGLFGCEENPASEETIKETGLYGNSYFNKELLMNMDMPQDWFTTLDTTINAYPVLLYSEESDLNTSKASMNLILLDASAFSDAALFTASMKSSLQEMYPGVTFGSDTNFQVDGNTCVEIEYFPTINGLLMAQRQVFISYNSSLIIVTFSCAQSRYSSISAVFDDVRESVSFEQKAS